MTESLVWPRSFDELVAEQQRLADVAPDPWVPPDEPYSICGCFLCFPRGQSGYGDKGDRAWAAAARIAPDGGMETTLVVGVAGAPYRAGLLALREGGLLETAVRALHDTGRVLLVNATGRDHPRRSGLALHLGAILDIPTVGVTHRPLVARGEWPAESRGASAPLVIDGERVGSWVRTSSAGRPLAVHPAWRTGDETARSVVLATTRDGVRTPEPIRQARRLARTARYRAELSHGAEDRS